MTQEGEGSVAQSTKCKRKLNVIKWSEGSRGCGLISQPLGGVLKPHLCGCICTLELSTHEAVELLQCQQVAVSSPTLSPHFHLISRSTESCSSRRGRRARRAGGGRSGGSPAGAGAVVHRGDDGGRPAAAGHRPGRRASQGVKRPNPHGRGADLAASVSSASGPD